MKKIFVGSFTTESNSATPYKTTIKDYDIEFDRKLIDVMEIEEPYIQEGVEIIPGVYANANAASVIDKETFLFIESLFLKKVREHLNEIDGIYLHLHGAAYVEDIGSGDHHILHEIRNIVGPYVPIAVSCDPHGNLTKEYAESIQILRSYRESPHIDAMDTRRYVSKLLCKLVKKPEFIHCEYRKLPLILGGEQSVSADEPVKSINKYMDELEKDPRIMSASWHVGYLRHDCPEAGCGIVVVPTTCADQTYAKEAADKLAKYVWDKRKEFHYTGLTAKPDEAFKMALNFQDKPFVITDSGDNTTSGATGWNTFVLKQFLDVDSLNKSVLFGSIRDAEAYSILEPLKKGDIASINLGVNHDYLSSPVKLEVKVISSSPIYICHGEVLIGTKGCGILVHVINSNIDIIVANETARITNESQFESFGINWKDYDIVVLKQGYIFPDFKKGAKGYVMSITDGATPQDTSSIPFKLIMRPMYPIDNI